MESLERALRAHFDPAAAPPDVGARAWRNVEGADERLARLAARLRVEATERGICRLSLGARGGMTPTSAAARRHADRAYGELRDYLAGRRAFFTVPVDLGAAGPFQARVLAEAARIPFGVVLSYAGLAARIGQPRAARAVGNALGANPVPLIVPCHRVVRSDGTWGQYALGGPLKTALLSLERATPALVGCTTTRIVCRHGCPHEQRVGEERRVVFASVADAVGVGYRACRMCRPADAAEEGRAAGYSVASSRRSES